MNLKAINNICLKICIACTFVGAILMIALIWVSDGDMNSNLLKSVFTTVVLFIAAFATLVATKIYSMLFNNLPNQ